MGVGNYNCSREDIASECINLKIVSQWDYSVYLFLSSTSQCL